MSRIVALDLNARPRKHRLDPNVIGKGRIEAAAPAGNSWRQKVLAIQGSNQSNDTRPPSPRTTPLSRTSRKSLERRGQTGQWLTSLWLPLSLEFRLCLIEVRTRRCIRTASLSNVLVLARSPLFVSELSSKPISWL